MRILMVNSNRYRKAYPVIPFGLSRVAAAIEAAGHEVRVLDLCFSENCAKDIENAVNKIQPDIMGITIRNIDNGTGFNTIFLLQQIKDEVIVHCKKLFSGPIIIGGPAVGISASDMLPFLDLEYAIRGDGELAVVEFINRIEKNLPLEDIGGMVIRKENRIIADNPPYRVSDMDTLPLAIPHRDIDLGPYKRVGSPIQIQTKRGCALKCTYCTYNRVEGGYYRLRSPQLVADEIELLVKQTGINHIEFTDSTFNIPLDHAKSLLRSLAAKKLDLNLSTMGLNPGAVDEELADLMKQVNFRKVDLGVESGSNAMLKSMGKNFTKDDVLRAGRILRKRRIPIGWYLLLGAPGETEETLMETFETMDKAVSYWDFVVIGVGIRVYKGTPIAEDMQKENPDCTKDNFLHPVPYSPSTLSLDEIKVITERVAEKKCNYYPYYQDIGLPPAALTVLEALNRLLRLDQPKFRLLILYRTLKKYLGISFLEHLLPERRNRNRL